MVMYNGMRSMGEWASLYFVFLVLIGNYVVVNLFIAILLSSFENHRKAQLAKEQQDRQKILDSRKVAQSL